MIFKVGDKVKVTYMKSTYKGSIAWEDIGKIGNIIEIWEVTDSSWPIRVRMGDREAGFSEDELTPYFKKGEQLLFSFMNEQEK